MKEYRQNTKYSDVTNEEEQMPESEVKESGGHGNRYSLPYGLCESVGIDTKGMTPREAWDAWTNKTGRTKEDAEREHWGKTASGQKNEKQESSYHAQVGDIITSGGMKLKILDVSKDGEKALAEILEGQSPSGLRKAGDKILFNKNSPLAQQAQKQPITPEESQTDNSPEAKQEMPVTESETPQKDMEEETPKEHSFKAKNYGVDEEIARRANEAYSMWGYKSGSATASYNSDVSIFENNVNALIDQYKSNDTLTNEDWNKVEQLAQRYSENLSKYTNENNRVEASYPSWFIAGPANYNTRKNDAKYSRLRSLYEENKDRLDPNNNIYLKRIKDILSNSNIQSDDENAIGKLQKKLDGLKQSHEAMKGAMAYYRKNGTFKGFEHPGISAETLSKEEDFIKRNGFGGFNLANSSAEIRRTQSRIDELNKVKARAEAAKANPEAAAQATAEKYPKVDGVEVQENAEQMRVQLRFPGKPDEATRTLLKSHGFRWSPSQGAWQRQLNGNGTYAAKKVMETLSRQKQ